MNTDIKRILMIVSLVAIAATTGCASLTASTESLSEQSSIAPSQDIVAMMRDSSQAGGE